MALLRRFEFSNLSGDIFGGLTAAIVALPLALAFGVSSGAGPAAGVYGAIFTGLFAALFGGTSTQVSGPTGPMTVVMATIFTQFSAIDPENGVSIAFTVVVLSGFFQMLFGVFKLGKYITLMPFPVISGFMSGIGIIIISLQLLPLFGHQPESSVIGSLKQLLTVIDNTNSAALILGILTLIIVFFCPKKISSMLPPALIALFIGTLTYIQFFPDSGIEIIGNIPTGLPSFHLPVIKLSLLGQMVVSALILASLGSIDSLLTSLVADNMTKTHHEPERELIGQGIGNMVAGLFGGLPGAGATMRTVVNIRAGGKTPVSGMLHALILLIIILGAGSLAKNIPHAVLAGILIKVGIDIIDWNFIARLNRAPLFVVILMLLVLGLTVFVNLITAVLVGVFLANIITVKRLSDVQLDSIQIITDQNEDINHLSAREKEILSTAAGQILLYHIDGPISYASVKGMTKKLSNSSIHDALIFDMTLVPLVDVSTAMAVENMIIDALEAKRDVYIIGMKQNVRNVFERMGILKHLPAKWLFEQREAALEHAFKQLNI